MKILYTSDTHVHPAHLKRLFRAAAELVPDVVIVGGDINPNWKKGIQASIEPHKIWIRDILLPEIKSFRGQYPATRVLLDLGNDDIAAARLLLQERDGIDLHLLHMQILELEENLHLIGYMNVNPTPFAIKDHEKPDCRDNDGLEVPGILKSGFVTESGAARHFEMDPSGGTIEDDFDRLTMAMNDAQRKGSRFILVSHCPPKDSFLDRTTTGGSVGSLAVRRFIERWAPEGQLLISLHGHIHESPWESGHVWQEIGGVPCFNVGQKPQHLRALLFDSQTPLDSARLVVVEGAGEVRIQQRGEWY